MTKKKAFSYLIYAALLVGLTVMPGGIIKAQTRTDTLADDSKKDGESPYVMTKEIECESETFQINFFTRRVDFVWDDGCLCGETVEEAKKIAEDYIIARNQGDTKKMADYFFPDFRVGIPDTKENSFELKKLYCYRGSDFNDISRN